MAENPVLIERDKGLVILTLNRPDAYNAIDVPLVDALLDALIDCDEDGSVRAVMITGVGKAFCAGGNLKAMKAEAEASGSAGPFLKKLTVSVHGAMSTIARMEKPVVAAVNGAAGGFGFSLALACDLVLAADNAIFTMAYTKAGLAPDGGSSFYLPRIVGPKRAYDLMVNNEVLSPAEAKDLGIVNQIMPEDSFAEEARAYCARLAEGPTLAFGAAKRLIAASPESSLETQMEHERRAIAACGGTDDFKEGVAAFVEKRTPDFKGE
jgi:2-(1,2-epoxy-1,2-dihydrophenyl)acetyl-CoA isomerase